MRSLTRAVLLPCLLAAACSSDDGSAGDALTDANAQDGASSDATAADADDPDGSTQIDSATECPANCTTDCPQGCFDLGDCTPTSGSLGTLTVHPNIHTAGLYLDLDSAPESASISYRPVARATWSLGHPAVRIKDGRLVASLFWLVPNTPYHVRITAGATTTCATFTTLPEIPQHSTQQTLYVDAAASAGGDGSQSTPLRSISEAIVRAQAGTDIRVSAGIYREEVVIDRSGESGRYLRIVGQAGAVLDGSAKDPPSSWTADATAKVWSTPWTGDPRYLARDNQRLYHFASLSDLRNGRGDDDVPIAEGFFADGARLWVRSDSAPSGHTWQIPTSNTAIELNGRAFVWIEGLEIRYYGEGNYPKGIEIRDSDNVVVRDNTIHDIPTPVWIRRGSNHARVEHNTIYQTASATWPWHAIKGTDHENTAINASGGTGAIVRANTIYGIFNGVGSGSFSDDQNTAISFDLDVYENRLADIGDDGLEPEGACINNRFWRNVVDRVHNGVSLAPITFGPTWVLFNRFTDYSQSGFKVSNSSSGPVLLYHNTCWTDRPDQNGMNVSGPFENMVFRNNVIRGTKYTLEMSRAALPNDLDYDNLYTTGGPPVIKWDNVRYDDLAALCQAKKLECNAQPEAPALVDPNNDRFAPSAASNNIDRALRLYGINDDYRKDGPDIGYIEEGVTEVAPLELPSR